MKHLTCLLSLFILSILYVSAQVSDIEMYQKAYNYLNDSVLKVEYQVIDSFTRNCNAHIIGGKKHKYDSELQVANKFIEIHRGFPMSDFVKQNYNLDKDCWQALRMGTHQCELVNHITDSLDVAWSAYHMKEKASITEILKPLLSEKKDGFQVFFSDIYKNTLVAELKAFCNNYDETEWYGSSTIFYFVFNSLGEIERVYSEEVIHYN